VNYLWWSPVPIMASPSSTIVAVPYSRVSPELRGQTEILRVPPRLQSYKPRRLIGLFFNSSACAFIMGVYNHSPRKNRPAHEANLSSRDKREISITPFRTPEPPTQIPTLNLLSLAISRHFPGPNPDKASGLQRPAHRFSSFVPEIPRRLNWGCPSTGVLYHPRSLSTIVHRTMFLLFFYHSCLTCTTKNQQLTSPSVAHRPPTSRVDHAFCYLRG
jgi:hypothetical protein